MLPCPSVKVKRLLCAKIGSIGKFRGLSRGGVSRVPYSRYAGFLVVRVPAVKRGREGS
jgi:hypothetical protein